MDSLKIASERHSADLQVKVALCQFKVTPTKEENLQTAKEAIQASTSLIL